MIRVAAYCRVSTDSADQHNSFDAQQRYFHDYIQRSPDWTLHRVYADEGVSGTNIKKRTQFLRMIEDGKGGAFQLILTKEVSRFSRNLMDTIFYTRELKRCGVEIWFINDGIRTGAPDAELRLSIMASIAQEESRKTSDRVSWGQQRQMEKGIVFGPSLLGYRVLNGQLYENPAEAEVVRRIFRMYTLEEKSPREIAGRLKQDGVRTFRGSEKWNTGTILKVLKNEKYVGDLIQRKTYTPDYLTHEKRTNRGEVPLVFHEAHHPPLIDRALWDRTQILLQRKSRTSSKPEGCSVQFAFSGKIRCGECGSVFVARILTRPNREPIRRWCCREALRSGSKGCDVGRLLREDDAKSMFTQALSAVLPCPDRLLGKTLEQAKKAFIADATQKLDIQQQAAAGLDDLTAKRNAMLDSYYSGIISADEMSAMLEKYRHREYFLRQQIDHSTICSADIETAEKIRRYLEDLLTGVLWSDAFCRSVLEEIRVYRDGRYILKFYGMENRAIFSAVTSKPIDSSGML